MVAAPLLVMLPSKVAPVRVTSLAGRVVTAGRAAAAVTSKLTDRLAAATLPVTVIVRVPALVAV